MKGNARIKGFDLEMQLTQLRMRHKTLKSRIAKELKRPAPCSFILQRLKRQRLKIKDEIARHAAGLSGQPI